MVDAWIIEEIEKEEPEHAREQPFLDMPDEDYYVPHSKTEVESDRGVTIIKFWDDDEEE